MPAKSPHELARDEMTKAFGIGAEAAHELLRTNSAAKVVYDCAVALLAEAIGDGRYTPKDREPEPRERINWPEVYRRPPVTAEEWELRTGLREEDLP